MTLDVRYVILTRTEEVCSASVDATTRGNADINIELARPIFEWVGSDIIERDVGDACYGRTRRSDESDGNGMCTSLRLAARMGLLRTNASARRAHVSLVYVAVARDG